MHAGSASIAYLASKAEALQGYPHRQFSLLIAIRASARKRAGATRFYEIIELPSRKLFRRGERHNLFQIVCDALCFDKRCSQFWLA
jgi:hypothetical protein